MTKRRPDGRVGILYLAPWVGYGGTDTGTIDWFRTIDRERFAPYLVTTQPSANERLADVYPYAEEVWALPEFLAGQHMQSFVFDLIHTRAIRLVHVMNSRLGFELMADMAALPHPPGVVVQLHVEEHDRSGYVRLVSTRYGNVVDGFSVISEELASAVQGYGVPPEKISVIPLGVDAHGRFDPDRSVMPIDGLPAGRFHILHTGRLTAQKDPLLSLDVMRRVVDDHPQALLHVVGEGELEPAMRERVAELGLRDHVAFQPMSRELERWYAGCDALLMTSLFEGIPCVVYEAMAMATPIVAPALQGNRELMGDTAGVLIEPREDAAAYAEAIGRLIDAPAERKRLGVEGRRRVLDHFTVQAMADGHAQLYERVLGTAEARQRRHTQAREDSGMSPEKPIPTIWDGSPAPGEPWGAPGLARRLRFAERPLTGRPLVSVVVPCFNHGRYLPECLDSILDQDYPELEVIVVDDASTEESTRMVLADYEAREPVTVLRQPENSGPSAARNRGIEAARGRYILPVDSDNLLLPGAIAALVEQLQAAGEQIGFIYPNCQYFGTRDDYFEPPTYNLYLLMGGNYCDTCSLIDRAVFDAGIRYPEHILLGHEDWDFALTLAARGVRGEPARVATLRYRKEGFTRSDAVEYSRHSFHEGVPERHPELYGEGDPAARYGRYWAPAVDIKARWAPGLSILLTEPLDLAGERGRALLAALDRQSCHDFELVLECPALLDPAPRTPLRRLPPGLCADAAARLQEGLRVARGPHLLLVGDELAEMAAEPGFVERLFRTIFVKPGLEAIAFTDAGGHAHLPHRLLGPEQVDAPAHALFWGPGAARKLPPRLMLQPGLEAESIARAMSLHDVALQWRHAPRGPDSPATGTSAPLRADGAWLELPRGDTEPDPHRAAERKRLAETGPVVPALPWTAIRRWLGLDSWIPPETELLTRHREIGGERRTVRQGGRSPEGYELEFHLGAIQRFSPPGTARLVRGADGDLRTVPRGSPRHDDEQELGHLEQAPLPLLNAVERAVLPDGSVTLVSGERDALRAQAVELQWLGFIEGYPNEPVRPPDARLPRHGRVSLLRCLDHERRRHCYRACAEPAELPDTTLVGELGALHLTAEPGSIPLWIDPRGRVSAGPHRPGAVAPDIRQLVRWVGAPAGWRGFGRARGRARSVLRRGADAVAIGLAARPRTGPPGDNGHAGADPQATLVGYLHGQGGPGRRELFAAVHPVTGDQLLTLHPLEAADMGYGEAVALGHVLVDRPLTGTFALRRVAVPWASRFGLEVRRT
ncbi:MAG TPA: glycosyltransferase [Solirubrobacteraceae bacterium]|nr:glycosyltransferase [Solirubrobacteraceae bacterium]